MLDSGLLTRLQKLRRVSLECSDAIRFVVRLAKWWRRRKDGSGLDGQHLIV
jgi:hypothetical protein